MQMKIKIKDLADIEDSLDEVASAIRDLESLQNDIDELSEGEITDIVPRSIILLNLLNSILEEDIVPQVPNDGTSYGIAYETSARVEQLLETPKENFSKKELLGSIERAINVARSVESALQTYREHPEMEVSFTIDQDGSNTEEKEETSNIEAKGETSITIYNQQTTSPINIVEREGYVVNPIFPAISVPTTTINTAIPLPGIPIPYGEQSNLTPPPAPPFGSPPLLLQYGGVYRADSIRSVESLTYTDNSLAVSTPAATSSTVTIGNSPFPHHPDNNDFA